MTGEKLENLGGKIKIFISDKINFTTDPIILASFASPSSNQNVMDIGSGCGIMPFLWCKNQKAGNIYAVEIDKDSADLIKKSVVLNNLSEKIFVLNEDVKNLLKLKDFQSYFDMVVCNPPYASQDKKVCMDFRRTIARHEKTLSIEELLKSANYFLKNLGVLCLCCRPDRLCDVMFYMRKYSIEPKILRFVKYKENSPSKLFLIKGIKNAKPGLIVENELIVKTLSGEYSDEMQKIYN